MSGRIGVFQERGCDVLGVSTDDIDTHARWLTTPPQDGGLGPIQFPLAADPTGEVCKQYGVYVERQRVALRGLFMIDPNGVLQYQVVHSLSVGRSTDEVLRVLDALQSGGLCPGERQVNGPTVDVLSSLRPGRVVGPYEILEELGSGTFGTVFRAKDTLLDRSVALKVLRRTDGESVDTLLTEARAAAALSHPNVCAVHTIDTSNGVSMIVMEFVPGRPLSEIIKEGPVSIERARSFGQQIAAGMAVAHDAGVIHGDLKPGNIVVTDDETVKVMDFGLARRMLPKNVEDETLPHSHSSSSTSSGLTGTLGYLAPELAGNGEPSAASDTFAVGLVIYEMLTGERAITGSNVLDTLRCIEDFDATPFLTRVPETFRPTLKQALQRQPQERPAMSQVAQELAR